MKLYTGKWFFLFVVFYMITISAFSQNEFDKTARDKSYKKGTNTEYYKNGKVKSISSYKRKHEWFYTVTYWTIKEYDMQGNQVRLIKKTTQISRKDNTETILKEEITASPPPKQKAEDDQKVKPQ